MAEKLEKGRPSVDVYAAEMVFLCSMNRAGIIWQSLLDGRLGVSPGVFGALTKLIEKALSLLDESDGLRQTLHRDCAESLGFLKTSTCIAVRVRQEGSWYFMEWGVASNLNFNGYISHVKTYN